MRAEMGRERRPPEGVKSKRKWAIMIFLVPLHAACLYCKAGLALEVVQTVQNRRAVLSRRTDKVNGRNETEPLLWFIRVRYSWTNQLAWIVCQAQASSALSGNQSPGSVSPLEHQPPSDACLLCRIHGKEKERKFNAIYKICDTSDCFL